MLNKYAKITTRTLRDILKALKSENIELIRSPKSFKARILDKANVKNPALLGKYSMTLKYMDDIGPFYSGDIELGKKFIYLPKNLHKDQKLPALLHELGHGINEQWMTAEKFPVTNPVVTAYMELKPELDASRTGLFVLKNARDVEPHDIEKVRSIMNTFYKEYAVPFGAHRYTRVFYDTMDHVLKPNKEKINKQIKFLEDKKNKEYSKYLDKLLITNSKIESDRLEKAYKKVDKSYNDKILKLYKKKDELEKVFKNYSDKYYILSKRLLGDSPGVPDVNIIKDHIAATKALRKYFKKRYNIDLQKRHPVTELFKDNPSLREV